MSDSTIVTNDTDDKASSSEEAVAVDTAAAAAEEDNIDYLNMSDDDFEKEPEVSAAQEEEPATQEPESAETKDTSGAESFVGSQDPHASNLTSEVEVKDPVEAQQKKPADSEQTAEQKPKTEEAAQLPAEAQQAVDAYKQIFAPFKANGKEVQVKNVDEVIRLMQQGAGHIRYQERVKPMLVQAQTLANNKIDDARLNFLIEVNNGNPDAIKKLVRDNNIDPYDISTDETAKAADKAYKAQNYSASAKQVTLNETLDTLSTTDTGQDLIKHVRNGWDDTSRNHLYDNPEVLKALNEHKQAGYYDQIVNEIDRRKAVGHLSGVPFLEAYQQVGEELSKANQLASPQVSEATSQEANTQTQNPAPQTQQPSQVIETRTARPKTPSNQDAVTQLSPTKETVNSQINPNKIMDMSDEEFERMDGLSRFA